MISSLPRGVRGQESVPSEPEDCAGLAEVNVRRLCI